jgi:hypothetical protein
MDARMPIVLAGLDRNVRDHQGDLRDEARRVRLAREAREARQVSERPSTAVTAAVHQTCVGTMGGLKS